MQIIQSTVVTCTLMLTKRPPEVRVRELWWEKERISKSAYVYVVTQQARCCISDGPCLVPPVMIHEHLPRVRTTAGTASQAPLLSSSTALGRIPHRLEP